MAASHHLIAGIVIGLSYGLDRFYEGLAAWEHGLKDGMEGYRLPSMSPHPLVRKDYANGNARGFAIRAALIRASCRERP